MAFCYNAIDIRAFSLFLNFVFGMFLSFIASRNCSTISSSHTMSSTLSAPFSLHQEVATPNYSFKLCVSKSSASPLMAGHDTFHSPVKRCNLVHLHFFVGLVRHLHSLTHQNVAGLIRIAIAP
mmetsp:Transcript_3974/g.11072  ORF Transcript_3974/g.11072 Transcript_3974/m.11072 type:complete len:123 (-) Transcript_3974:2751-3119(-)